MRTLHELYCILWHQVKDKVLVDGICREIVKLGYFKEITSDERYALRDHFYSQKPSETQHADFYNHPSWRGGGYWWNEKETSERKRFIKLMMEITK